MNQNIVRRSVHPLIRSIVLPLVFGMLALFTVQCTPTTSPALETLPGWKTYSDGNDVNALAFDGCGHLWAGGQGGVVRWDLRDGSYVKFTVDNGPPNNCVSAMAIAADGSVWVGTRSGTTRFDGRHWISYTDNDGLADMWTTAIAVGPDGAAWVASDGGLSRLLPPRWSSLNGSQRHSGARDKYAGTAQ